MDILATFSDETLNISDETQQGEASPAPTAREAARGIIMDENDKIVLLYTEKHGHHKLPGGGIDPEDVSWKDAFKREAKEEAGCTIFVSSVTVGKTVEQRTSWNMVQTSYCGIGHVLSKGKPELTESEVEQGFQPPKWVTLDEAVKLFEADKPKTYLSHFMHTRDMLLLKEAIKVLKD